MTDLFRSYTNRYNAYSSKKDDDHKIKISEKDEKEILEKGTWGIDKLTDQKFYDNDYGTNCNINFNSICKMEGFNGFSYEELRFIDYFNHQQKKIDLGEIYEKNKKESSKYQGSSGRHSPFGRSSTYNR
jgi:hypothetical protein